MREKKTVVGMALPDHILSVCVFNLETASLFIKVTINIFVLLPMMHVESHLTSPPSSPAFDIVLLYFILAILVGRQSLLGLFCFVFKFWGSVYFIYLFWGVGYFKIQLLFVFLCLNGQACSCTCVMSKAIHENENGLILGLHV